MSNLVEAEIAVLFTMSIVFSLLFEYRKGIIPGVLSSFSWIVHAGYWLVAANTNATVLALLFMGLGVIYLVRWMVLLLDRARLSKLGELEDPWDGMV